MTAAQFIAKWSESQLTERSAAQQHFLDLCALVGHPTPAASDPTGESFTFARGAAKHGGGDGWADVWKGGFFGWEYKGRHKDLDAAYDQLPQYREALGNPPLLVVCDMDRILVHTNFTGTAKRLHEIPLHALAEPRNLETLVEPVVMTPLRREWTEAKGIIARLLAVGGKRPGAKPKPLSAPAPRKARAESERILDRFQERLARVRVLDPACGSGNFRRMDAIPDLSDPEHPREPEWPEVDFIVGNPPFLGDKLMRGELGDGYVESLRKLCEGSVPGGADLCCYWFERARREIAAKRCRRAGLLATQGIRGGANREVLKRIKESGDVFFAESDRPWILDGANVHVSMVAFDDGEETTRLLDGAPAPAINANLTSTADITTARRLKENSGIYYVGTTKRAPLDIDEGLAIAMLVEPNPHGRPNSDVVVPYLNARVVAVASNRLIIDFPVDLTEREASLYVLPFEHVRAHVLPLRVNHREAVQRKFWWRLARPSPELKAATQTLPRYLATPQVSKHRVFVWLSGPANPDHQLFAFARADDYFLGVLQSRAHEVWALRLGTRLETRPRYTPTTCFETFPFPFPHDWATPPDESFAVARLRAAHHHTERSNVVQEAPPPYDTPGERRRRFAAIAASASRLSMRTLTRLYNERPAWLGEVHRVLDESVLAAYGLDPAISDEALLAHLLALNLERAR